MQCEHCQTSIEYDKAHSLIIVLQKVTPEGFSFYQCDGGQTVDYHNWQHWHCSKDHCHRYAVKCINEHYTEEKLHPISIGMGSTILHTIVLGEGLQCKVCGELLSNSAYRFRITRATPYNEVIDDSHNQLGGWCCSLEHAKQDALNKGEKTN